MSARRAQGYVSGFLGAHPKSVEYRQAVVQPRFELRAITRPSPANTLHTRYQRKARKVRLVLKHNNEVHEYEACPTPRLDFGTLASPETPAILPRVFCFCLSFLCPSASSAGRTGSSRDFTPSAKNHIRIVLTAQIRHTPSQFITPIPRQHLATRGELSCRRHCQRQQYDLLPV